MLKPETMLLRSNNENIRLRAENRILSRRIKLLEKKVKYLEKKIPHKITYGNIHIKNPKIKKK
jgi:hypothetical protein